MSPGIFLVIPCFHESGRLPPYLEELSAVAAERGGVSILVVDDGSGPEEQARLRALVEAARQRFPFIQPPLLLPSNGGKGAAVYAGWRENRGEEWLAFADADGACPAGEVRRLIGIADRDPGSVAAVFASRVRMLGYTVERPWHRHLAGRVFATVVSRVLDLPVYDSQCGLKLIRREAWQRVEPVLSVRGFAFDIELMAALADAGCRITEVPVNWHEVRGGKLRLVRDAVGMLETVFRLRARRRTPAWRQALARRP